MPFGLGFGELLLISVVMLLLFGAKRLPEVAAGMGKGIRDFKRSLNGLDEPVTPIQTPQTSSAIPPAAPAATQQAEAETKLEA